MTNKNQLPNDVPHEFAVTIRKGVNPKTRTPQWEGSYTLTLPATLPPRKEGNPFARALQHLVVPAEPVTTAVKVVVNEKEWSGPLGEGEVWVVKPRSFLAISRILFADALYRSPDSPVVHTDAWFHPAVRDIYERMAWDLSSVGGQVELREWEWSCTSASRGRSFESYRRLSDKSRHGGLKSFLSEGGWLRFNVEFSREAPTDEDYYHREYWTEEFAFPLHECSVGWNLLSDRGGIEKFNSTIYTTSGVAITLPRLLDRSWRGVAGPFDLSRVGQPRPRLSDDENDQLVASLLPGRLTSFYDRETVEAVGGSDPHLIGVVSAVERDREGWFVRFERNELFFRAGSRHGEPVWRTLGQHHVEERDYRHYIVMPNGQRTFAGFAGMRFRSLRLPEHREHQSVPHYELVQSGGGLGFEGVLSLRATLPANNLLGDGKGGWVEQNAAYPFEVEVFGDEVNWTKFRHRSFPEHLMRRFS